MQRITKFQTFDRSLGASPPFHFDVAEDSVTIAAAATYRYSIFEKQSTAQKYMPFNNVSVTNSSGQDVIFYPNQDLNNGWLIPNNTIKVFKTTEIPALSTFALKNNGSSSIISGVRVEFFNSAASTEFLGQKIVEKFGGLFGL